MADSNAGTERIVRLLRAMSEHRHVYLGPGPAMYSAMCGFISGFMSAKSGGADLPWDTFDPPGFREFVIERVGGQWSLAAGWQEIILRSTTSEDEALDLYMECLSQYVTKSGGIK